MAQGHGELVEAQFGPQAKAYVESAVHASGADLDALEAIVRAGRPAAAIDLGCGGGHVSYLMARHAARVTAVDLSKDMLAAVAATAQSRGLGNIETHQAAVEKLSFADARFDFLGCRYSAHHWQDFEGGLREARRVLKPDAPAVFIDAFAQASPLLDTHLQAVELLRDTSHVRDYSQAEWLMFLGRAGFAVTAFQSWRVRMDFPVWITRMRTPAQHADAIRSLQNAASAKVRQHFEIEADGSFMLDVGMFVAKAA